MSTNSPNLFRTEYEREMETWLARRLRYFCTACIVFAAVLLLFRLLAGHVQVGQAGFMLGLAEAAAAIGFPVYVLRSKHWRMGRREEILNAAFWLILLVGASAFLARFTATALDAPGSRSLLLPLFFWHLMACAFLPWTPRESLRPFVPLFIAWVLGVLWFDGGRAWYFWTAEIVLSPIVFGPGLLICWWRLTHHGRHFRTRMFGQHFFAMREELARARSIHDSVFPDSYEDGHVRFDYTYTPMREMGGDYIHLQITDDHRIHVTLIDVTGHGLAAALTVNRVYGELERIRAEMPDGDPAEVLNLLNRYFNLTLVKHTIYATAACATIDVVNGTLTWASAGHPPAFLRGAGGAVSELPATTVLLGAAPHEVFAAPSRQVDLVPGDVLVMYTDGVFEARNRSGEQFGLDRLRRMIRRSNAPGDWPQFIASAVKKHTGGFHEDDVLIASVRFAAHRPKSIPEQVVTASMLQR